MRRAAYVRRLIDAKEAAPGDDMVSRVIAEHVLPGNLSRDDLQFDSPYNTYRYGGLPPGPIAAPGRRALEAVVSPAAVDYLYFVSRNDGTHVFATTLAEHNRNVFQWQVLYFRNKRANH